MGIKYTNSILINDYYDLVKCAGWKILSESQVEKSLKNTSFLTVANDGNKAIGIARFLTDFSAHGLLFDVIVLPEYRNMGIGRQLVQNVLNFVKSLLKEGEQLLIELLPTKDKTDFYLRCGFKMDKEKMDGMYLWVKG
jgi:GNAT superfamily N-acetyltransferase